jgi:multidrug efflux pump subunit AcrA (membrane-fusion protein)
MKHSELHVLDRPLEEIPMQAPTKVYKAKQKSYLSRWINGILVIMILCLFLPWTQNIQGKGKVTTLLQSERPQEVNSLIAGRILRWYVKEGDLVRQGDTIVQLGEVKVDYFDPELLARTEDQIRAKDDAMTNYRKKATTADAQIKAMREIRDLKLATIENKLRQQKLKIQSDSAELEANKTEQGIFLRQLDAAKNMLDQGIIAQTEFERRKANYQNSLAKFTVIENKILQGQQELTNLLIEKNNVVQDYLDKSSKTEGDKYSSLSEAAAYASDIAKLKNTFANYSERSQFYFILAPQDGQIGNLMNSGIGEIIKEGDFIAEIIPANQHKAVEMFIDPVDLPLVRLGQKVMFVFDGFPAIQFSGWPNQSFGTFPGYIYSIESATDQNGKFRILVTEDPNQRKWPPNLRIGGGAEGIALLKDVPIYYEIWRTINGFPPEYYQSMSVKTNPTIDKKPE